MHKTRLEIQAICLHLLLQIIRRRLPNQRLATPRRTVQQKPLGRTVLKPPEQLRMQHRHLNRIFNRLNRVLLSADLFPRQIRNFLQIKILHLGMRHLLQRHAKMRIDAHLLPRLQCLGLQIGPPQQNMRLRTVFLPHLQAPIVQHIDNFTHRTRRRLAHIAHHGERLIDQHPRPHLQIAFIQPPIHIGIILCPTHRNIRDAILWHRQQRTDPIGRCRHLLQRPFQLHNRAPRLLKRNLVFLKLPAQLEQQGPPPIRLIHRHQNLIDNRQRLKRMLHIHIVLKKIFR